MSQTIQTKVAYNKLKQKVKELQREMTKDVKALSKGLFIAAANANIKKGSGVPPKAGSKKATNGDWTEGPELTVSYYVKNRGKIVEPISKWIEKINKKNFVTTYTDKTGKTRKRKVSSYKLLPLGYQREPIKLFAREIWRKGSKGSLPYSWGAPGEKNLADYYLRKNWRTEETDRGVIVRISATKFKGEKVNDRVLKLLDEGGFMQGSKQLIGFHFVFQNLKNGRTGIYPLYEYGERPMVRMRGYKIKRQVVGRINRALKHVRASQISTQHWRQIGSGK